MKPPNPFGSTIFIRADPARQTEHGAWRDENVAELLRHLERGNAS